VKQTAGYTVAVNANQTVSPGGTVTFAAAPAAAKKVRIERDAPLKQESVWTQYSMKPGAIEKQLDVGLMQIQQVDRRVADAEATHAADKAALEAVLAVGAAGGSSTYVTSSGGAATKTLADWMASGPVAASNTTVSATGATALTAPRALKDIAADVDRARGMTTSLAAGTTTITLASPFPATGVTFTRTPAGVYSTSFNPDTYVAGWPVARTIYVNLASGNDTTGTGLAGAPYKTVKKALAIATAAAETAIQITVVTNGADVLFQRDTVVTGDTEFNASTIVTISGKRIYLTPDDTSKRLYVATSQQGLTWSLAAGQTVTYQATRSNISNVVDMSQKDAFGIPTGYAKQASIASVEATAGSWFESGGIVYVHTLAGAAPVNGTHLVEVSLNTFQAELGTSGELFLRNTYFLGSSGVSGYVRNVAGDYSATKFVAWNCAWAFASPAGASNGLSIDSVKAVQIYRSVAAFNSADGFNFHYTRIGTTPVRDYYALVFGSVAYNSGIGNTTNPGINNGFTSHEGAHVAYVASHGWNTQGPIFANVNGCNSIIIGCTARTSVRGSSDALHAAFYFDNASAPEGVTGAAYVDDSEGADSVWDLSSDGSVPITVRDFNGSKVEPSTALRLCMLPGISITSQALANLRSSVIPVVSATQRDALVNPAAGLTVFNTTTGKLNVYTGSAWQAVTSN
jgi:hypothetical protein